MNARTSIDDITPEEWNKTVFKSSWAKGIERKHNETFDNFCEVEKPAHYNFCKF